jgi:hypothetical protein
MLCDCGVTRCCWLAGVAGAGIGGASRDIVWMRLKKAYRRAIHIVSVGLTSGGSGAVRHA